MTVPFSSVRSRSRCGSPISAALASHGPIGEERARHFEENQSTMRCLPRLTHCRSRADHHRELALVIHLGREARDLDRLERPDQGAGRLLEDDRLRRHVEPGLLGVLLVVRADQVELRCLVDRRPEPDGAQRVLGQAGEIDVAAAPALREARQERAEVGEPRADVVDVLAFEEARAEPRVRGRSEADELHAYPFLSAAASAGDQSTRQ
jgi:hypothetical protein